MIFKIYIAMFWNFNVNYFTNVARSQGIELNMCGILLKSVNILMSLLNLLLFICKMIRQFQNPIINRRLILTREKALNRKGKYQILEGEFVLTSPDINEQRGIFSDQRIYLYLLKMTGKRKHESETKNHLRNYCFKANGQVMKSLVIG